MKESKQKREKEQFIVASSAVGVNWVSLRSAVWLAFAIIKNNTQNAFRFRRFPSTPSPPFERLAQRSQSQSQCLFKTINSDQWIEKTDSRAMARRYVHSIHTLSKIKTRDEKIQRSLHFGISFFIFSIFGFHFGFLQFVDAVDAKRMVKRSDRRANFQLIHCKWDLLREISLAAAGPNQRAKLDGDDWGGEWIMLRLAFVLSAVLAS